MLVENHSVRIPQALYFLYRADASFDTLFIFGSIVYSRGLDWRFIIHFTLFFLYPSMTSTFFCTFSDSWYYRGISFLFVKISSDKHSSGKRKKKIFTRVLHLFSLTVSLARLIQQHSLFRLVFYPAGRLSIILRIDRCFICNTFELFSFLLCSSALAFVIYACVNIYI